MSRIMFIDGTHREQIRVAVTEKGRVTDFDIESFDKKQTIGNIYLAKVTRVEPSLQAAFVEYGAGRQGFLSFSEIHPDYYQIPQEDRKRLLEETAALYNNGDDDQDEVQDNSEESTENLDLISEETVDYIDDEGHDIIVDKSTNLSDDTIKDIDCFAEADLDNEDNHNPEIIDTNLEDNAEDEKVTIKKPRLPRYKIQEVIKKRQILLVQVLKSERGNKGAALTTYLSLAGRYCVLMPNTACGGGISRKITDLADRKKLRNTIKELGVPETMGLIVRTAGLQRTKVELKRDYEYLVRLWDSIRQLTMSSIAPSLVYEEGNLIKRSLRDVYSRETSKILIQGEEAYRQARDIMKMIMPSAVRSIHHYRDPLPLLSRYQVERQLDELVSPEVTLKSGGYLVINHTEALIAIDVNSGKSTNAYSVEETAFKTNLEAAEEIARQLRLRDLAGLIVIDFIDMESQGHVRSVERKMRDYLKNDKARIQVTPLSVFGLMEMTRQRLRPVMKDLMSVPCHHCNGVGFVPSLEMSALRVLRSVFEEIAQKNLAALKLSCSIDIAHYLLNKKRQELTSLENEYGLVIELNGSSKYTSTEFDLETHIKEASSHHNATSYQEPISDSMMLEEESHDDENSLDNSKKNNRDRGSKKRNNQKKSNHIVEVKDNDIDLDTNVEDQEKPDDNKRKSNNRRNHQSDHNGKSRFNKKRHRRFDNYTETPDNYMTESGNNVVIENPVSVKNIISDEIQNISEKEISNNIIIENTVNDYSDDNDQNNDGMLLTKSVAKSLVDVIKKAVPQETIQDIYKDNIDSDIKENVSDNQNVSQIDKDSDEKNEQTPEAKPQKPARKGWWRNRFGL